MGAPTDSKWTFMQTFLVDYQKAFDHLDHNMIILKLEQMGVPEIQVKRISP